MSSYQLNNIKSLSLGCLLILFVISASASHLSGGNMSYEYIGPTPGITNSWRYKITVKIVRDCTGILYNCINRNAEFYAECTATGTQLGPYSLDSIPYVSKLGGRVNTRGAKDISDLCTSLQSQCQGNGQVSIGYEMQTLVGYIDLPRCDSWKLTYQTCAVARNVVQNFTGGINMGMETFVNTDWRAYNNAQGEPDNSSPVLNAKLKPFISACIGQHVNYAIVAHDKDGDSLTYEPSCPWDTRGTVNRPRLFKMTPNVGYSCDTLIPGLIFDRNSGLLSFTAQTQGNFLVPYYINEYERCTGALKGRTYGEIQISIGSCTNQTPVDSSRIGNLSPGAFVNTSNQLEVCEGDLLVWEDTLSDPDVNDSLILLTNIADVLPGATITEIRSAQSNTVVARYSWRAQIGVGHIKRFFLRYADDNCDLPASIYRYYDIKVNQGAVAGEDTIICFGDTANLRSGGGFSYSWRVLSGDTIRPGINWFPEDTLNSLVKFSPGSTTVLETTVSAIQNLCGDTIVGCKTKDTVIINVASSFSIVPPVDTTICFQDSLQLNHTTSNTNQSYSYSWSPSSYFTNPTDSSTALLDLGIKKRFYLKVTSDSGCSRVDSFLVKVSNPFPKNMSILASDTDICYSGRVQMEIDLGQITYNACGLIEDTCRSVDSSFFIGNGNIQNTANSTSEPVIFGSRDRAKKLQFLYRAVDLKSLGMTGGPINSIGFEVVANRGNVPYDNFNISMTCTNTNSLSNGVFVEGLIPVYSSTRTFTSTGINSFVFHKPYIWDGVSNLIIDVCFDNGRNSTPFNSVMSFDSKSYGAALQYKNNSLPKPACTEKSANSPVFYMLPKTVFTQCYGLDEANFKYKWSAVPASAPMRLFGDDTSQTIDLYVDTASAQEFIVSITDTSGLCRQELSQKINLVSKYNTTIDSVSPLCVDSGILYLKSGTRYNIIRPGGKWTGNGIINDSLGWFNPKVSGPGNHVIVYEITGNSCASKDSITIKIIGKPDLSVQTISEACVALTNVPEHELVSGVNTGVFSGYGVDSVLNGSMVNYFIDGTKFNPQLNVPDTAHIRHSVFNGCFGDTTFMVPIIAQWDTSYRGIKANGAIYNTRNFCATSNVPDTLVVEGANGVWSIDDTLGNNIAILDSTIGVFDPRLINGGQGGIVKLVVENNGFCGAKGTHFIAVIKPPEVQILAEDFCFSNPGDCPASGIAPAQRKRLIKVRIAKFPNQIIDNSDSSTFVDVITADKSQTGWNTLVESDVFTKWDGNPWMITPYKCEYPFCTLQKGKYPLEYQLALQYRGRNQISDTLCYSHAVAEINITDQLGLSLSSIGDLCNGSSVNIQSAPVNPDYTYLWSTGAFGDSISVNVAGVYSVTMQDVSCSATDSISISNCANLEEENLQFSASVYPNPARNKITIDLNSIVSEVSLTIHTVSGQLMDKVELQTSKTNQVDVSRLKPGVYLFRLESEKQVNSYRVVIE